jgi:hypothetical protein
MFGYREGRWKYAERRGSGGFSTPQKVDGGGQLYDLARDPRETKNMFEAEPKVAARMAAALKRAVEAGRTRE